MPQLIGLRAYARHRKCSLRAVQKAIETGRISLINGKIDADVADIQWARNTDPAQQARGASGGSIEKFGAAPAGMADKSEGPRDETGGTYESGVDVLVPAANPPVQTSAPSTPPADDESAALRQEQQNRLRESALSEAARRQLLEFELAQKKGELVRATVVRQAAFNKARVARDALLSLPDRIAMIIAAESDPAKVHAILVQEIRKICEELARGEASPTRQ